MGNDIIVYCAKGYGEKVYLSLLSIDCHVVAFSDNAEINQNGMRLGRPVYSYHECRMKYPEAVYVVANSSYATALEIGSELEKDGFVRDSTYFLSIELEIRGGLPEVRYKEVFARFFSNQTFILFGRPLLCDLFARWIESLHCGIELQICPSEADIVYISNERPHAIWIPLEMGNSLNMPERDEELVQILQSRGVKSFSRFFLTYMAYCRQLASADRDIGNNCEGNVKIRKVLYLRSSGLSGSSLINSVLDMHPNILFLGLNLWGMNIWFLVKKAANVCGEKLAEEIIKEIRFYIQISQQKSAIWLNDYQKILRKYFQELRMYSEREIFINIHLAYYEFLHGIPLREEAVIYMDIHSNHVMQDGIFTWLGQMGFEITILEMIRIPLKRFGSAIKWKLYSSGRLTPNDVFKLLCTMSGEELSEREVQYPIVRIRFEDLKMYPRLVLEKLCDILDVPWSDTLLRTTEGGKESIYSVYNERITGFDLKPVYYSYDEYFDAFDKFRLDLLFREKSKAYGYPYVGKDKYPMSLQDIGELFGLPFKFECFMSFQDEAGRRKYRAKMRMLCMRLLYLEENRKRYQRYFQFGEYLSVEHQAGLEF